MYLSSIPLHQQADTGHRRSNRPDRHAGHPEGYTATDIVCRMKRMQGYNVLHPMGFDSFGLPAEQYAIQTGHHPEKFTKDNIETFRKQLKMLGFSYDWDREISTSDPDFYKWTQWIFKQLFDDGLAKCVEMPVNWCEELGTVLANDEVIDGKSERGGYPVVRKNMRQWVIDIVAYAEKLLDGLNTVDWPESTKEMQRNWIGKSVGAHVIFKIDGHDETFTVFTTRCDTLFGATYCVFAPEHELVDVITTPEQKEAVKAYQKECAGKSDLERTELNKEKTGVFTGAYALNPVNGKKIPIWISDYVLATYGTGAIMDLKKNEVKDLLDELQKYYTNDDRGFEIERFGDTYRFLSKAFVHDYAKKLFQINNEAKLSNAAMETLAIIAYKQPITRVEIEEIRGVGADVMLHKLEARGLIKEDGRSDAPGRPILYSVTDEFMDAFKLMSLEELPELPKFGDGQEESDDLFTQ